MIEEEIKQLVMAYCPDRPRMVREWPVFDEIKELSVDANKLLQQEIDIVYALGGDGTLLSLLRALYKYYSHVELPPIAAFNMVSQLHC